MDDVAGSRAAVVARVRGRCRRSHLGPRPWLGARLRPHVPRRLGGQPGDEPGGPAHARGGAQRPKLRSLLQRAHVASTSVNEQDAGLGAYGWNDRFAALFSSVAGVTAQPGRIVRHDRGAFLVAVGDRLLHLPARRSVGTLTVGDWVVVDDGAVSDVLERSSLLRRRDPSAGEQLLAANVDVVAMVFGADRPIKPGRLYRTRTQIWDAGAAPLVVLTKTDLLDDADSA